MLVKGESGKGGLFLVLPSLDIKELPLIRKEKKEKSPVHRKKVTRLKLRARYITWYLPKVENSKYLARTAKFNEL